MSNLYGYDDGIFEDLFISNTFMLDIQSSLKNFDIKTENQTLKIFDKDVETFSFSTSKHNSNKKLGINNTNPSYNLDVSGNINLTGSIYKNGVLHQNPFDNIGNDIYNTNTGNVGIGTSNPLELLHIKNTSPTINIFNSTNNIGVSSVLQLGITGNDPLIKIVSNSLASDKNELVFESVDGTSQNILKLDSDKSINIYGNLDINNTLNVNFSTNKVGILNNNPQSLLHLSSSTNTTFLRFNAEKQWDIKSKNSGSSTELCLTSNDSEDKEFVISSPNNNDCISFNTSTTAANQKVYIQKRLSVGINNSYNGLYIHRGNLKASGWIRGHTAGQLLNSQLYNPLSNTTTISSGQDYTSIYTLSYTPVDNQSTIYILITGEFTISGFDSDSVYSRVYINNISQTAYRRWRSFNNAGGGERSNNILPISCVYTNSSTSSLSIQLRIYTISTDDSVTFYSGLKHCVIINEIKR